MLRIGLISDTHGLLRPEAITFLRGCDHIIHAGDIGNPGILEELSSLAPVAAVRGNNDTGPWAKALPETKLIRFEELAVYVLHDVKQLNIDPTAANVKVVISGHSHKPSVEERQRIFYVNPGSAGPRRFKLPISVGELIVSGGSVTPRVLGLGADPGRATA